MTGPNDDPPRREAGGRDTGQRPLPPELDPRRPVTRRRTSTLTPPTRPRPAPGGTPPGGPPPGGRPPGQHRKWGPPWMRRWSRRRLMTTLALGLAVVLVIVVSVGYVAVNKILDAIHTKACPSCSSEIGGKGLNILVIGSDSRNGLTSAQKKELHVGHDSGQRSDTMILMHVPANGGKADMVSLPRDSYVTIPAHCPGGKPPAKGKCPGGQSVIPAAPNKLNASYSFGGANLAVSTVQANTHVPINHYVVIDFIGFVTMVDKLGGVPICTAKAISDPVRRDPSTGGYVGSGLQLPAGKSTLHGTQALEYVRAREFDPSQGDLGRIQRQQKFMGAMLGKAESAGVLLNLPKLYGFLHSVASSLTVDAGLSHGEMLSLARKLHSMSPKNVNLLTVPLSDTNYASSVGSAVLWNPTLSKQLFHDFSADKPITNVIGKKHKLTVAPSSISVKVLNATSTNGLASQASQALARVGFGLNGTGNAPKSFDASKTVVAYGASRAESAKTLAAAVPGATTQEDDSLGNGIELVVGSNYSTVKSVKVSSPSSSRPTVRTGATNPCS
jgi:LCP family protein required for cell wall assembly